MRKALGKLRYAQNGSITLEVALTLLPFILMLGLIGEVCRLSYISAVLDFAVHEAAKQVKNDRSVSKSTYEDNFQQYLKNNAGSIWNFLGNPQSVDMTVRFSDNIRDLTAREYSDPLKTSPPLAIYRWSYNYSPFLMPLMTTIAPQMLSREAIFVQEY